MDNNIKDRKVFISVILPVYNVEKYITKCLESLIHQSFKDLEFIFIGDSGTDGSMRIVEEYKKKDDRIVVLYNETNLGPGLSRNKGLDIAKGDYISFVDPDDWLDPHFYENLYAGALESKCDIIKGNLRLIDEEGNDITVDGYRMPNECIAAEMDKKPLYLLFSAWFFTAIYKSEFLKKESISFPPLRVGEDSVFLLQACIACNDIAFCDDAIYFHLNRSDSITNTNNYQKQIYALEALKARIEQLNSHGFDEFAYIYLSKVSTYYLTNFKQYLENNQKASRETVETYLGEYEAIISSLDDPQAVFTNVDSYRVLKAYTDTHNNDVKVSVILPLYKCAQYMRSLLDSVCGQTFRETEIICVLDGPDEEIRTIIEDRAKFDARIICLEQEHGNAGTARNTGMAIAKGEYLLFLDADDLYSPVLIEKLYNSVKEHDADIAMCSSTYIDEWTKTTRTGYGFDSSIIPADKGFDPDEIDDLYNRILCVPWNKLFRHQMITEQQLRFSGTRISNDFFFVCAAMTCAKRMVALNDDLVTYRKYHSPDSLSSNRGRYSEDSLEVTEQFYHWLKTSGYWKRRRNDFINRFCATVHYHAGFAYNEAFADGLAKTLSTKRPWKTMSNVKLVRALKMDLSQLKRQKQFEIDEMTAFHTKDSAKNKMKRQILENKNQAFQRIYTIAKQKYGRDLKKRTPPVPWLFWSVPYRGWTGTFRRIAYYFKGEQEQSFRNVTCAGHITGNRHYIECFLPMKTYREKAVIEDLSIAVRSNGGYLLSASGKKKKTVNPLGPSRSPLISNGAPTRKKELLHVFADVVPGLGITISIAFANPLYKNRERDPADNNHPASVNISGKIRLR